jgi:hypothetical protein
MTNLPESLIKNAIKSGNEFGWKREDVKQALQIAKDQNLACLGGQVQFVFPKGICELYWRDYDPSERKQAETWESFVVRSCNETEIAFDKLPLESDLIADGVQNFPFLKEKKEKKIDLKNHLIFILDFISQKSYENLQSNK